MIFIQTICQKPDNAGATGDPYQSERNDLIKKKNSNISIIDNWSDKDNIDSPW